MIGKVSHQIGKMCWYFRRTQGVLLHLALPYLACRLHYAEQLCDFMYEICTSVQSANIPTCQGKSTDPSAENIQKNGDTISKIWINS